MQKDSFTFLLQSDGAPVYGSRAIINSHVAKLAHRKRRWSQQREIRSLATSERWRPSGGWQCGLHLSTFVRQCSWCQQAASTITSVALYCGNSDPFDSLPVPIDAKANQYLTFGRMFIGPLVRGIGPPDLVMSPGQAQLQVVSDSSDHLNKDMPLFTSNRNTSSNQIASQYTADTQLCCWGHSLPLFDLPLLIFQVGRDLFGGQLELGKFDSTPTKWNAAHANAVLAYCANALSSVAGTREHLQEALKYSTSCIAGLRECLNLALEQPQLQVEELVYRLLRADVAGKNLSSASLHAKYLKKLLEKRAEVEALDPELLTMVMHSDNQLAIRRKCRPTFDSFWLQGVFAQSWIQADMLFSHYITYDIDYDAPSIELQDILVAENKLFWQSNILRARGSLANQTNWHWFVSQREWAMNCILHRYADTVEANRPVPTTGAMASSVDTLFEECLLLAAFCALRFQKKIAVVSGVPLFGASTALGHEMDWAFGALEQTADEEWSRAHAQPLLWITFVVALTEHKHHPVPSASGIEPPWLVRLHSFIQKARLQSWPELQAILRKFPYTEQELPLPQENWLDEAFARV